jgi:hypothetical protein
MHAEEERKVCRRREEGKLKGERGRYAERGRKVCGKEGR